MADRLLGLPQAKELHYVAVRQLTQVRGLALNLYFVSKCRVSRLNNKTNAKSAHSGAFSKRTIQIFEVRNSWSWIFLVNLTEDVETSKKTERTVNYIAADLEGR